MPLTKPVRLTSCVTRHPVAFGGIWGVDVIYTVSVSVDGAPEVARLAVVGSTLFLNMLSRLVRHMDFVATDRSFANAKVYGIGNDSGCRLPQDEIAGMLGMRGRVATIFVKTPPYKSGMPSLR